MPAFSVQPVAYGRKAELVLYCKNVKPGEGQILECLEKNDKKVSPRCKDALKEVGLKK